MSFLGSDNQKLALIIGINYTGKNGELRGCITDTEKIINMLKRRCGYTDSQIILLTDETELKPTKSNILNSIDLFVDRAHRENAKELWFSYSGHGSYTWNNGGDNEQDNKDEALVPLDYDKSGLIRDDVLNEKLVRRLPKDAKLFSIIDACHSGTSLDLPYIYRVESGIEDHGNDLDCLEVCKISGCRDSQTSADAYINDKYQGALTFTFIKTLNDFRYNMTPKQIICRMKNYLKQNGYTQIPTLAMSKKHILDDLVIGDDKDFNPNINIYLEGDKWCKNETKWNIYNIHKDKLLFHENRRFYMANEKVNYKLELENGVYILIFYDSYGDGGVQGNIKFIKSGIELKNFVFNSGKQCSVEFYVNNTQDVEIVNKKREITCDMICDYYGPQESNWNIVDSLGRKIFDEDNTFSNSNQRENVKCLLAPGKYSLVLSDSYGDGGINGKIKSGNGTILDFNWTNLDWSKNNGYNHTINFNVL